VKSRHAYPVDVFEWCSRNVSSADFRHIAVRGKVRKSERLFRAAVSAFCALTRPGRREIAQFEDLTLSLFHLQPKEAKRFAAAALSDAVEAPNQLIRRLCEEPVDVAAPLLIRSPALTDIELIALIGRHGLPHARAIARRAELHPSIAALIRILESQQPASEIVEETVMPQQSAAREIVVEPKAAIVPTPAPATPRKHIDAGAAAERMRDRLRGLMVPASTGNPSPTEMSNRLNTYARLKLTVLTGNPAFFQTALADALEIDFTLARTITESGGYTSLASALKSLDLSDDQAFLITAAVFPNFFSHAESVRLFVERYQLLHREAAREMVRGWRAESAARSFLRTTPAADNSDAATLRQKLKAS